MRNLRGTMAVICLLCANTIALTWGSAAAQDAQVRQVKVSPAKVTDQRQRLRRQRIEKINRRKAIKAINFYRQSTWKWQKLAFRARTPTSHLERRTTSLALLKWIERRWRGRMVKTRHLAQNPPHKADWLCIQSGIKGGHWSVSLTYLGGGIRVGSGEGSWTTDGKTYDGGLQMDHRFQSTYARGLLSAKGTANKWNAYQQMWVAERALQQGRGFSPWPNTARACGLL